MEPAQRKAKPSDLTPFDYGDEVSSDSMITRL
jgi:hypothetical protein